MTKLLTSVFVMATALHTGVAGQANSEPAAHVRTEFHFTVNLPYEAAFPLFGALGEQNWAPDWKPQFLYPNPPADKRGAVFLVSKGPSHSSVWMTTKFDVARGEVQHVFVLNDAVITLIDIVLKKDNDDETEISVAYEWTALDPGAADHVRALAKQQERAAEEWKAAINSYAARRKAGGAPARQMPPHYILMPICQRKNPTAWRK